MMMSYPPSKRFCFGLVVASLLACSAGAQTNEFRALWADAWSTDLWTASGISTMVNDLRAGNFNAVVAQVRRRGDALYTSHYEPKCKDISSSFDPLADLIAKAHNTNSGPRLEVHAWVVTYHIWKGTTTPPQTNHPLLLHPDWLLQDINGNTLIGNEYTFDPGHPEVQKHTLNVCLDLLTNYDIDGLNFDYIRYASTSEGYNPVTVARFNRRFNRTGTPATGDATWTQFRRDQVTALLRKVYLHALAVKPNVKISCDTISWSPAPTSDATWYSSSAAWNSVLQDWRGWMEEGIMDMGILMNYFRQTVSAHALAYTNWSNFAKDHRFNRHTVIGPGIYLNSIEDSIEQMRHARRATSSGNCADGVCGYDFRVTNSNGLSRATFLNALVQPSAYDPLGTPMFAQAVGTPVMSWKTAPTKGHLKGFVYGGSDTNALDGAVVTLSGTAGRSQTNDATGFFGFVDLAPGSYTLTVTYPGYVNGTTNVTVTAGLVATRDLVLSSNGPPVILNQPISQAAPLGSNATFTVTATGSPPLAYQWRWYGTNLASATASSLTLAAVQTNQAGPYDVVVTNLYGALTSGAAALTVTLPPPPGRLNPIWSLAPGSRSYLTVNSLPLERGIAYDALNRRLLVVSRTSPRVFVLDGDTGADLHELNVTGISGGTYPLLMIGVADDGAVYAANLTTAGASSPFKIYRWANDNPGTAPAIIYSGDPSPGNNQRWGDTLDVRGAGADTQILAGSRSGTNVALFTTTNGTGFVSRNLVVPAVATGSFGLGVAFGSGNTFWGKASSLPLRRVSFNLDTGAGGVLETYADPAIPNSVAPIGVNPALNLLAGISIVSPNHLRLYDLASGAPVLVATNAFPTDNDNTGTGTGSVDFGGDRLYALDGNNGLLAMQLALPPSITNQPQSRVAKAWTDVTFTVTAGGTAPLAYQWRFGGVNLSGATSSALTLTQVQTNQAGTYTVLVTNIAGSVLSAGALLTVEPPAVPQFSGGLRTDGRIVLDGAGDPGLFSVEASTNLVTWDVLAGLRSTNGTFQWSEATTNFPQRFYRVRWGP